MWTPYPRLATLFADRGQAVMAASDTAPRGQVVRVYRTTRRTDKARMDWLVAHPFDGCEEASRKYGRWDDADPRTLRDAIDELMLEEAKGDEASCLREMRTAMRLLGGGR